jgi:hypothetical protein
MNTAALETKSDGGALWTWNARLYRVAGGGGAAVDREQKVCETVNV